jgi:hypothetical protein
MSQELSDRELDALVAEKVMGFDVRIASEYESVFMCCAMGNCGKRDYLSEGDRYVYKEMPDHQPEWLLPHYSTDISAAMEVVEKMREREFLPCLWAAQMWIVEFWEGEKLVSGDSGDSLPRAICLAALKAINGDAVKE